MKISRRRVLGAGVAVVAVVVAVLSTRVLRRLSFFRVRQVEVVGTRYLDESDVARRLGLRPNASTFDKLAPVRLAAAAIPGVLEAWVERRLPGTLRVTLREASPIAITDQNGRLMLMDSGGHILPFDPTRVPASLPIAAQDSGIAVLLTRLLQADRALYASIDVARLDRGDVVLDVGPRRIRLRPEADDGVLHAVTAVITYLKQGAIEWREIDARYRSRVFVQKGAA